MPIYTLSDLPEGVERPLYSRDQLRPRLVHISFGAFARAHMMSYHQDYLHKHGDSDWGVVVADMRSGAERFALLEDNGYLYSVLEHSDAVSHMRVIGSIIKAVHPARGGFDAFFDPFMEPDLAIVSLTITEKGYCLAAGHLDHANPDIAHDLGDQAFPKTVIGALVEILHKRREAGLDGFTVLSLDNLPSNGKLCRIAVMEFAEAKDAALARWIEDHVTFPSSMVDRIVPALTDESRALIKDRLGHDDPNGIVCEPFRQWVIEDDFIKGRPGWEEAGAQFVADVEPFEEMKLRMLNGAHSFLAYLGYLGGLETISDCMGVEDYRQAAHQLMVREQMPTLSVPSDVDLPAYADALIERFSNSQLRHKTAQIASDGSQKLPQRMLASIAWHIEHGSDWSHLALGVAGWLRFMRGTGEDGKPTPINDPMADVISQCAENAPDDMAYIDAVLALDVIFPPALVEKGAFVMKIKASYSTLVQEGARASVAALL